MSRRLVTSPRFWRTKALASRATTIVILVFASTAACTVTQIPRPPVLPAQIAAEDDARKIIDAYKLVCADSECRRADGTYSLDAAFKLAVGYREPSEIASNFNDTRDIVAGPFAALGLVSVVAACWWSLQSSDPLASSNERDRDTRLALGAYGASLVFSTTGLILYFLMPEPEEEFATAYNDALERDVAARVAAGR